jgi:glutamate N-acetyltransferase/amino-acid N-acetyltransferase
MIPQGYEFAGVRTGLKSKGRDLAIICSREPSNAAALFTTNKVCAAPIIVSREHLSSKLPKRAIVVNSGYANTCTGHDGVDDARTMCKLVAKYLKCEPEQVLVASTGIIGHQIPMDKISLGIENAFHSLSPENFSQVAQAILTTDTKTKIASDTVEVDGKKGIISGVAKGSGMISPNMATMLSFIVTDIAVEHNCAQALLTQAVDASFHHLTIDGDTSTNDCVILLYNKACRNLPITPEHSCYHTFKTKLTLVCQRLAKMIAQDGEGATKLIKVWVQGALSTQEARVCARTISNSLLVKTALFGADPNWGRIAAAAGRSNVCFEQSKLDIYLDDIKLVHHGKEVEGSQKLAHQVALQNEYILRVELNVGNESDWMWTCDLSYQYVTINAKYHT